MPLARASGYRTATLSPLDTSLMRHSSIRRLAGEKRDCGRLDLACQVHAYENRFQSIGIGQVSNESPE